KSSPRMGRCTASGQRTAWRRRDCPAGQSRKEIADRPLKRRVFFGPIVAYIQQGAAMVSTECEMSAHYSPGNLLARLNAALIDDGIDPEHPSMEALAPYDQFHGRGLEATLESAELVEAGSADHRLHIACAMRGPGRHTA